MRPVLLVTILLTLSLVGGASTGEAAGPWKAQVVDAETGQPLESVIVLAYWLRMTRGPGGPSPSFYDAEEVVTGPNGRFTIASRWTFTLNPFTYIDEPEFKIFKPGYGAWVIRGWTGERPKEWEDLTVGEILAREGIVIELPRLKTRGERLKFHDTFIRPTGLVPLERMRHLNDAWAEDRRYLGLGK